VTWLDALPTQAAAARVAAAIIDIANAEGPVHFDRLAKLTASAFGLERVAEARIDAITRCIPRELRKTSDEPFAWPADVDPETWADYRPDALYQRPVEHISKREYANAIVDLCRKHMGVEREDLTRAVLNIFGGTRLTEGIRDVLNDAVQRAIKSGRIVVGSSGFLQPGD
jgi:hypothetical protein